MKLHLPSALRKAVLACLAALALPATLPTTLATASGIAAAWLISSQQLTAAAVTWTYGDGATEQVECSGTEYTVASDAAAQGLGDFQLSGFDAGSASYGKFWTATETKQHDTLHITGGSKIANGTIRCDWGNFLSLGALIVDATESTYTFDNHTNRSSGTGTIDGQKVRFQAGESGNVRVRIGSSTAMECASVKLDGNGDWVIGGGKTFELTYLGSENDSINNQFLVTAGKTLTLSKNSQEGVGTLSVEHRVVSDGNITIRDGIHASFQNGMTLNGNLTIYDGGSLSVSNGVTVVESGAINLVTDVVVDVDDPFWFFAGEIRGLDSATTAKVTVNGQAVGEGKKFVVSGGGTVLEDGTYRGGAAEFTGPQLPSGQTWDSATHPASYTKDYDLSTGGDSKLFYLDICSSSTTFNIRGGSGDEQVKLNCAAGDTKNTVNLDSPTPLNVKDLWITHFTEGVTGSNNTEIYVKITGTGTAESGYLNNVQNLYVNDCGVMFTNAQAGLKCNFYLGTGTPDAYYNAKALRTFTLSINAAVTTTGKLHLVQDAQIVLDGHDLTVGDMEGGGDLILSAATGGTVGKLVLTGSGENFAGHVRFERNYKENVAIELADGSVLSTAGIYSAAWAQDANTKVGGQFTTEQGGTATVKVTGHNPAAAEGIVFGAGVTLELAEGAVQNFGKGSQIAALTGSGVLGVQGGDGTGVTVAVSSLTGYTGDIHLFGNGTGKQAVLQVGGTSNDRTGTLSKVVLRQGGGDLRFGQGEWTLNALDVAAAPSVGEGASQLGIGVVDGASNVKLRFGGEEGELGLGENVELRLGKGVDYSGTVLVDASGDAAGARLFDVADAALLDGLTLKVVLDEGAFNEGWAGLQLFAANLGQEMKDALLGIIELEGGALPEGSNLELNITRDGVLRFLRSAATLDWLGGGVWQNGGSTQWEAEGEAGDRYPFQVGDSVNFDASEAAPSAGDVTVVGTVQPNEMTVKSGEWSFTGGEGEAPTIDAASLRVEKGASAAIAGNLSLSTEEAMVNGELRLEGTGSINLGTAEVGATGAIHLGSKEAVGAGVWSGTNISGDGKVVLDYDATESGGEGGSNLFAALFAGGDVGVERDAKHVGIGTFEVAEGVILTLGEGSAAIGKSLSLVRNMRVDEGGMLVVQDKVFDNVSSGYTQTGTITLAGSGVATATRAVGQGALVFNVSGGTDVTWNVALEGDAVIANQGEGEVRFIGGAELNAAGHTLTFAGGAFRFGGNGGGFYAAEGSSGTLALEDGVSLSVETDRPADYSGYDIKLLGENASLTAHSEAKFNNVDGSGRVDVNSGRMLILVGRMGGTAEGGGTLDVVLRSGADLIIRGNGGKEASKIDSLTLGEGDAAMELTLGTNAENGVLGVGQVWNNNNAHTLTVTLNGMQNYIDAHRNDAGGGWTVQLFTGGATGSLHRMSEAGVLQLEGVIGYDWELDETGRLHLTEKTEVYRWTDTKHGSAHQLTWRDGTVANETGKWDGEVGGYENGVTAELVGDTGEAVTVTVSGVVEAKEVRITGTSAFTFNEQSDGGSLHAVDMKVGADSTFNPEVALERRMTVRAGKTATFTGGLVTAHGSEVALEGGATVRLVGDNALKAKAGREMKVTGSGNWDVDLSGAHDQTYDGKGVTMGEGVKMRLTGVAAGEDAEDTGGAGEDVWSNVSNLNAQGELELVAGKQVVFTGTNLVGRLTADYTNSADAVNVGQLVLEGSGSTLSVTGEGDTDLGHVVLDLRDGVFTQMKGTLTVGGLRSNLHSEGVLEVQNLAITAEDTWDIFKVGETGGQRGYSGSVHVAGNFTMNGKVWEEGNGGEAVDPGNTDSDVGGGTGGVGGNVVGEDDYVQHLDGEVTVGGTAMVQSGVLDVGSKSFTVGGQLGVSGGQFKWHGGDMEVGSLSITGDGAVELTTGEVTVNGGISGDGGALDISGAPIEESTDDEVEEVRVTLKGEEGASYAGEVKLGKGGTLAVESTGQVLQHVTAVGGDLSVGEGKNLTVGVLSGTAPNPGLRNVTLGAGANWTVRSGSFTLAGTLTWGAGASITLEYAGEGDAPNILLGGEFQVGGDTDNKLTFNLSAEYLKALEAVESDGKMRAHFLDNDRDGSNGWKSKEGYMEYFDVQASDDPWNYSGLTLDKDGYLTWTVKEGATWYEAAEKVPGVWSDKPSTSDTSQGAWVDVQNEGRRVSNLADKNVYLTNEKIGADGQAELNVEGVVHPRNVYVESGVYTLTGSGGGIDLKAYGKGMLVVQEGAVLNLQLKNTRLPMVIVEGKLGLWDVEALPEGTELRLNKEGTLSYTKRVGAAQDVSGMVSDESKSTALHVEVEGTDFDVTWGTAGTSPNSGLKLALDGGTVKSGDGNFTLKWADAATHAGKQEVKAGSLTLEAGGKSVLSGGAVVSDGASLVLRATDALTYSGVVTGGGTLEVARGEVTLSGNNTVSKITLTGGTTVLGSDGGLGNENTVLTLDGGDIQAGNGSKVNAGSVEVVRGKEASIVAGSVEITGKVTGRGTLRVDGTAKGTLSGDISEFTGTLDTGTSTWTLSRVAGEVGARVMGKGRLVVNSKEEITLVGDLGTGRDDEVTLQNDGSGDLVIATGNVGSGTKLQTSETGDIVLGNAGTHVVLGNTNTGDNKTGNEGVADASPWSFGAVTGAGSVVLANVTLPNAGVFGGGGLASATKLVVRTTQGGLVDVAGMDAGKLSGITVNERGLLTGAVGEYTVGKNKGEKGLELHFTDGYWAAGTDTNGLKHLIGKELSTGGAPQTVATGKLSIHQGNDGKSKGLQLAFDASILKGLYAAKQDNLITFCVRALDGETATWDTADGTAVFNALMNADDQIANVLAMAWKGSEQDGFTQDGMVLTVELNDLYLVMKDGGDKHESTSPVDLLGKKATVVLDGQKLTLNWAEDGTVSNLVGTEGAQLEINNTAKNPTADRLRVTFDNTFYSPVTDDRAPGEYTTKAEGQDTEFAGAITGGRGVDITKDGLGTLTVGGNYTLEDGTTRIEGGRLVLSGEENAMKALEFAYQEGVTGPNEANNSNAEERGLVLDGGHTVLGTISDGDSKEDELDVVLQLQHGAELSLSGESMLSHTDFIGGGEENGSGTVVLEGTETGGGALALTGDASIKGVAVKLNGEKTVLDVGGGENSLVALNGNGVLRGAAGGNLTISGSDGGTFSGTLDATPGSEVGGKLTVQKGASFTLQNASSTATDKAHGWNVDVQQGGSLTLDLTGKTTSSPLVFGNVSVAGDMTMKLDASLGGAPVKGNLTITDTSTFTVYGTGRHGETFSLGFSMAEGELDMFRKRLTLDGTAFLADVVDDVKIGDDGTIWITTRLADENRFTVRGAHKNAQAGSSILWGALRDPNSPLHDMLENPTSGFAMIVTDIYSRVNTEGGDTRGVDRALAAIAGTSISTLGSAVSQDMHRQLTSIRNRTTTMAAEVTPESYGRLPLWHAWINGETDYHKLDADSFAPGFTLNSWGGTIGVDVDLTPHATAGLAVTAMYGDLKTEDAPDTADGSVDSVYVSAFLRATSGSWVHSLVISAGAADISLDRTVSYGGSSYRTSGSTDGYSLGALYEVGYSRIMNKRGTVAVQPVVNVEIRHVGVDGYTETGSDGALKVDDIDQTVVTFGAGARMQAAMGTNAFNRTAVFESRLLVKVDAGDRSSVATTGLKGSNGSAEVESAEVGAYGVEAGAGISVPLGRNYGSLFLDGSVEFRDGWTSANATLGYRINF